MDYFLQLRASQRNNNYGRRVTNDTALVTRAKLATKLKSKNNSTLAKIEKTIQGKRLQLPTEKNQKVILFGG